MKPSEKITIGRKEHFNAAHRLYVAAWTEEKNKEVFGKCSYPHYHGHNYEFIVKLTGIPDTESGVLIDLKTLSNIIHTHVIKKFDHKNLNLDTEEFKHTNPTVENIAKVIYHLLRPHITSTIELQIILYETERNFAEYPS
jgi:6-pyruvoyltetrahydropterin/6-carboxytetrahydropterin synthase